MFRGLLIPGVMTLAAASAVGCVGEEKEDLPKGVVDESNPPGSPIALETGKGDAAGKVFAFTAESAHPYANNVNQDFTLALDGVVPACTSRARLHFASLRTERGYDFLSVLNPDGTAAQTLDGNHDNSWSEWVGAVGQFDQKQVKLHLTSDYSVTDYGFRVDQVEVETAVRCPLMPILVCSEGYFDTTPTPGVCECRGQTQCVEDAWVEIEHTAGGGIAGTTSGRRLTGQLAQNVSYTTDGTETSKSIGNLDRAQVQALVHAIVDSKILDAQPVLESANWTETLTIKLGTKAITLSRPSGTFPADQAALIQQFEALFACGGTGAALTCGDGFACSEGACAPVATCMCPALYQPVCGADGHTYSNGCAAGCANQTVVHDGECGIVGDFCGGQQGLDCLEENKCRYGASTWSAPYPDAGGNCVADTYCDAAGDCTDLPHVAVPGSWACQSNSCAWVAGPAWLEVGGFSFSTPHPYANNQNIWKTLDLPSGATKMRLVSTGQFELEQGYDKLEVWTWKNGAWVKSKTYSGTAAPASTDEFAGQHFYLHFVSDSSVTKYGFSLTAQSAQ